MTPVRLIAAALAVAITAIFTSGPAILAGLSFNGLD